MGTVRGRVDRPAMYIQDWVVSLPGGPWYRQQETADLLGVTKNALKVLERHPHLRPDRVEYYGRTPVKLYTRETVQALREHFRDSERVGRPPIYAPAELAERRKMQERERYYRRLERKHRAAGADGEADKAKTSAAELRRLLDQQARSKSAGAGDDEWRQAPA